MPMEGSKKIGGRHLSMILWSLTLSAPFAVSPSDLAPIQSDKGIKIFLPLSPIWAALELHVMYRGWLQLQSRQMFKLLGWADNVAEKKTPICKILQDSDIAEEGLTRTRHDHLSLFFPRMLRRLIFRVGPSRPRLPSNLHSIIAHYVNALSKHSFQVSYHGERLFLGVWVVWGWRERTVV